MIAQKIITILIVLALVLSVSSRPYANSRLAVRQTNDTVIARQLTGAGNNIGDIDLNSGTLVGGLTLEQATEICGSAQMNCCRKTSGAGDSTNSGLINSVFGSGDLGILCNPIDNLFVGLQIPIEKLCNAKAACCQSQTSESGLVDLDCTVLDTLI